MMKKVIFPTVLLLLCTSLQSQELLARHRTVKPAAVSQPVVATKVMAKAAISWQATNHNFGEIVQGVPVNTTFTFTNTGSEPLLITQVVSPCGCTVTTYSKEAIAPGGQGFVSVSYNAAYPGVFRKAVTVSVNTEPTEMVLSLQGTVIAKESK